MSSVIGCVKFHRNLFSKFPCSYVDIHTVSNVSRLRELDNVQEKIEPAVINGWVKSIRRMKTNVFIDVNDGSTCKSLQIVIPKTDFNENITHGCSLIASGNLLRNHNDQLELLANKVEVVGKCDLEEYPFRPKKIYTEEYIRQYLHYRFRTNKFSSVIRVRHKAAMALHDYFANNGFINIHTPIITGNDCEGAGEVFTVLPDNTSGIIEKTEVPREEIFFSHRVYLSVSGQLHLETAARGLGQVYSFGPIFRAENSKSRLHLSEFYMAEAELAFVTSLDDVTNIVEDLIRYVTRKIIEDCSEDIHNCRKLVTEQNNSKEMVNFEETIKDPFIKMSYSEASDILLRNKLQLKSQHVVNESFTKEHELFLVNINNNKPIFIIDWPIHLKPFYMKSNSEIVSAFDLLCPLVGEVCGGSIREDDFIKLKGVLEQKNLLDKLQWYLDLRKFGNVPTGGFGIGFDRFLQVLLKIPNIKDVIPFPRWPHNCQM